MQLPSIVVSPIAVPVFLSLCCIRSIGNRWGYGKLSSDLLERCLGFRQSKLMAEEDGFGRITVGCGEVEGLRRVNEGLSLLHKARKVEHGSCYPQREAAVVLWLRFDVIPLGVARTTRRVGAALKLRATRQMRANQNGYP
jgi:hypothetical protein